MYISNPLRAALREAGFKQIGWRGGVVCTQASWERGEDRLSAFQGMPEAAILWSLLRREREIWRGFDVRAVLASSQARPQ